MESLWHWGSGIIVFIQAVHNPVLDGFFNAVIFTGEAALLLKTLQNLRFYVNFLL
jgi:hypothetical protein